MRILIVILLFCYYEAFVKVYCAEESEEIFGNYIFKKSENLSEFAQKVFRPEAIEGIKLLQPDVSTLTFQPDKDSDEDGDKNDINITYSVGDRNISNSFKIDRSFKEETWLSPASTVVQKSEKNHYIFTSILSTGQILVREEIVSEEGFTVIMTSPVVNFTSTLYYESV